MRLETTEGDSDEELRTQGWKGLKKAFSTGARTQALNICPTIHLLPNEGYLGVIHLQRHADTYTDN